VPTCCHLQVRPTPALWALLLALLGAKLGQAPPHTCSVPELLHHYRAIIAEDLQAAVRRGVEPGTRRPHAAQRNPASRPGRSWASCSDQEEHSILLSIASLGRALRGAVAVGHRGTLETAAWTVAVRTEAVMRRHCGLLRQQHPRPQVRVPRRRGSQRQLLLRALDAVATCWEKLFALRAAVWPTGPAPCGGLRGPRRSLEQPLGPSPRRPVKPH
ncbi:uncharacterized protein C20orf204 homolog, partial [Ochotona princeps]|uniref:uncharacterized protein C20orf204 homolog n=1 Tax=Ochotona princeps TaxID=9978 RepID=UPI002714838E